MKILILGSKEYPFNVSYRFDRKAGGGFETHVEKLAKHLSRRNEVFIVTRRFPGQSPEEDAGRIHVRRTRFLYNRYLRTLSFNFFSFFKSVRLARRERMDIIHCHGVIAGFFGSILSRITRVPMVFTPHGVVSYWSSPFKEILRSIEIISLKSAKKTIFISDTARKELSRRKTSHIHLPQAIDLDDYSPGERKWKNTRFLFMGRLEKVKGIEYLLEAFEKLNKANPEAELYIAGIGTMEDRVIEAAEKNKKIHYLGWIIDTPKVLGETDVFVLPSREKGYPVALLEAMASDKIIITSLNHIRDRETGLMVKPRDSEDLYKKMLYAIKNFKECKKLGENARKSVANLEWKTAIKAFEREYQKVIKTEKQDFSEKDGK